MEKKQEIILSKKDREEFRKSIEYIGKQLDLMVKAVQIATYQMCKAILSLDWSKTANYIEKEINRLEEEKENE